MTYNCTKRHEHADKWSQQVKHVCLEIAEEHVSFGIIFCLHYNRLLAEAIPKSPLHHCCTQWSECAGIHLAVAMRVRFPQIIMGIVNKAATPIIKPKMPKGSAAPLLSIHSPTKNVHAKLMMARKHVIITKQSPDTAL